MLKPNLIQLASVAALHWMGGQSADLELGGEWVTQREILTRAHSVSLPSLRKHAGHKSTSSFDGREMVVWQTQIVIVMALGLQFHSEARRGLRSVVDDRHDR